MEISETLILIIAILILISVVLANSIDINNYVDAAKGFFKKILSGDKSQPLTIIDDNTIITLEKRSGGGNSNSIYVNNKEIIKFKAIQDDKFINFSWEVKNGIGCCKTYDCDYDKFYDACLDPFRLFEVYINGNILTLNNFTYQCSNETVWNYITVNIDYYNLTKGKNNLKIDYKDCSDDVILTKTVIIK